MEELDEALQLLRVGQEKLGSGKDDARVTTVYKPLVESHSFTAGVLTD
jgi:hypothetical protein